MLEVTRSWLLARSPGLAFALGPTARTSPLRHTLTVLVVAHDHPPAVPRADERVVGLRGGGDHTAIRTPTATLVRILHAVSRLSLASRTHPTTLVMSQNDGHSHSGRLIVLDSASSSVRPRSRLRSDGGWWEGGRAFLARWRAILHLATSRCRLVGRVRDPRTLSAGRSRPTMWVRVLLVAPPIGS